MRFLLFFIIVIFFSCSQTTYHGTNTLRINIDSIHFYEHANSNALTSLPFITYNCTVKNLSDSIVNLGIPIDQEDSVPEGKCYLLASPGTIVLYLDAQRPVRVAKKGESHFELTASTLGVLHVLKGYQIGSQATVKGLNAFQFLRKIARESSMVFEWPNQKIEIRNLKKAKVTYSDTNNNKVD